MKKLNKFFAVLVALAMMATLCVSMAFAIGDTDAVNKTTNADYDAVDAQINKVLVIPKSDVTPLSGTKFNFTITAVSATAGIDVAKAAIGKTNGSPAVTVNNGVGSYQLDTSDLATAGSKTVNGTTYYTLSTSTTLSNLFTFTKPGEYVYTIAEGTTTKVTNSDQSFTETFTDNVYGTNSSYKVRFYVNSDLEITDVTISNGSEKVKVKVTPSAEDPTSPEGATFVNKYEKKLENKESDGTELTNGVLNMKKEVEGTYGDTNQQFTFYVKLTKPATCTDENATVTIKRVNGSDEDTRVTPTTVPLDGTATKFTLANNEYLVFETLPAGTVYEIYEALSETTNGDKYQPAINNVEKTVGSDLATTGSVELTAATDNTVKNTFQDATITPTGILISNLPYIALALVAIGGLVAYVVVRRRQDDEA